MEASPSPFTVMPAKRGLRYLLFVLALVAICLLLVLAFIATNKQPPPDFPVATPIVIEEGSSISKIISTLHNANVIKSELLLYVVLLSSYTPSDIKASTYIFDQPYDVFAIAKKLASGDFTSTLVRLTHREGERVTAVHDALPAITYDEFILAASTSEGYLFPETYFLPPHFTAENVVATLRDKYEEFIIPLRGTIAGSGMSEYDVLILASILEREANSAESMGMVAGILRNRLDIGMALQADASIEYILDKPLGALVPADLKIDSPYNTYLNTGLPPTPIGNPGKVAIEAVLNPTKSDYLFYITGTDGKFYYAKTYEEHKKNIARYLK
jgi:UPF0755 protein